MVIDSHVHLWNLERGGYRWLKPELAPIDRTIEFDELARRLAATGVDAVVLVQSDENDADTDYLLDVAEAHAEVPAVSGWLPLDDPARVAERLDELTARPYFRAVRVGINMEPDAEWILRDDVAAGLDEVAARGLPFDLVAVRRRHLDLVPELCERHPDLRIVIDHLSKPPIGRDESWVAGWRANLARAAASPNVFAKISGLTPAAGPLDRWEVDDLRPFVEHAVECFGAERLMFGSDWPVSELAGSYERVWEALSTLIDELPEAGREAVYAGTARRFYGIDGAGE